MISWPSSSKIIVHTLGRRQVELYSPASLIIKLLQSEDMATILPQQPPSLLETAMDALLTNSRRKAPEPLQVSYAPSRLNIIPTHGLPQKPISAAGMGSGVQTTGTEGPPSAAFAWSDLFLQNVQIDTSRPEVFSGSSDIFHGTYEGQLVAAKRLRPPISDASAEFGGQVMSSHSARRCL